jgi:hypothetical protein
MRRLGHQARAYGIQNREQRRLRRVFPADFWSSITIGVMRLLMFTADLGRISFIVASLQI